MKVIIVDDDISCIDDLLFKLKSFEQIEVVGIFKSKKELLDNINDIEFELAFVDIMIDTDDGFDVAQNIYEIRKNIMVVFLTGHIEYAYEGYNYDPIDFIGKPFTLERLEKTLKKAFKLKCGIFNTKVGININGELKFLFIDKILYIEKIGRKSAIVCKNNKIYYTSETMKDLEMIFLNYDFYRAHNSYIVSLNKIREINKGISRGTYELVMLFTNTKVLLSRSKYKQLKNIIIERNLAVKI